MPQRAGPHGRVASIPAIGGCIGAGIGTSFGAMVHHVGVGVAIGAGVGLLVGGLVAFGRSR